MKIVSKFTDYYDGCRAYGIDPNLVYIRHTEEKTYKERLFSYMKENQKPLYSPGEPEVPLELRKAGRIMFASYGSRYSSPSPYIVLVLFCGKSYFGMVTFKAKDRQYPDVFYRDKVLWNLNDMQEHSDSLKRKNLKSYHDESTNNIVKRFSPFQGKEISNDILHELKAPVVSIPYKTHRYHGAKSTWEINPCLKDLDFAKAVDPFTAFQELSMYIGGVLGVNKDGADITDDKMLRDKRGFNKHSFRMDSPGKKRKRKKK